LNGVFMGKPGGGKTARHSFSPNIHIFSGIANDSGLPLCRWRRALNLRR
jgi:hypothetical protein